MNATLALISVLILSLAVGLPAGLRLIGGARRRGLKDLAGRLGLRFSAAPDRGLPNRFAHIHGFGSGPRCAFNVVSGLYRANEIFVFDIGPQGAPWLGRAVAHRADITGIVLVVPASLPSLMFGPDRRPEVRNPRATAMVCNARVRDFLLNYPDLDIQIGHDAIALVAKSRLEVTEIQARLDRLIDFRLRMPSNLFAPSLVAAA